MRRVGICALIAASMILGATNVSASSAPAKLTAADAGFDFFGSSVATTGSTTIVGAPEDTRGSLVNAGGAYVYTNCCGGWTQQAKLVASDAGSADFFGASVSVTGDTAVVGAQRNDNARGSNAGATYVFFRSGSVWSQQAKLMASDGATEDRFGLSVAVAGNTAVVGAPQDDVGSASDAGSAYVFVRSGTTWTQQAKLNASDPQAMDRLGTSVAIVGDTVVVGAYQDDPGTVTDAGSAYVFTRSGTVWSRQAKLVASDPGASDWFGVSVAVSGDTALVGAYADDHGGGVNAGSAYAFTRSGNSWTQHAKLIPFDATEADLFGASVSLLGNVALIGASRDDHSGFTDAGSAYAYVRSEGTWALQRKLIAPDPADRDTLGFAVALGGEIAVAGVPNDDHSNVVDAGSAIVFDGFTSVNTPPDTTITSGPPPVTGPDATFTFAGVDDLTPASSLTFQCSLDASGLGGGCTSPVVYANLGSGRHVFRVAARDAEGNLDPTPASYEWTVDTTGPTTTISAANNDVFVNIGGLAPVQVTGRVTDGAAGVEEVTVTFTPQDTGEAYIAAAELTCSSPSRTSCTWSIPPPGDLGRWRITARARDALGNVGPTAGPITIIVIALPR